MRDEACSEQLFREVTERFSFAAGSQSEYDAYFTRSDLPAGLWSYALSHEAQATSGFAVVPKKNKGDGIVGQRKLLMCCDANLVLREAKGTDELGLYGGGDYRTCSRRRQASAQHCLTRATRSQLWSFRYG